MRLGKLGQHEALIKNSAALMDCRPETRLVQCVVKVSCTVNDEIEEEEEQEEGEGENKKKKKREELLRSSTKVVNDWKLCGDQARRVRRLDSRERQKEQIVV